MKINKYNALRFWEECYGSKQYAEDFHGNLMCKDGYGNRQSFSLEYRTPSMLKYFRLAGSTVIDCSLGQSATGESQSG